MKFEEIIEKDFDESIKARNILTKKESFVVGNTNNYEMGVYLSNYANCLLNRQLDIFDDTIFLLDNERIQSACIISRGMIETYAFARLLGTKIAKILTDTQGDKSIEESLKIILDFTNSSRFKVSEQKKVDKGIFNLDDYTFTEQAKNRMINFLAGSEHVMDALRSLYKDEMEQTESKESQFELTYDILSEWVHPSQTSIFHYYTPETHSIPTSQGTMHLHDNAKASCARALHFITDCKNVHEWLIELADEMNKRSNKL